jgi:NADH dehydrogenase
LLIVGAGIGGYAGARTLQSLAGAEKARIFRVSDTNYLLFTPMLAEVVGGVVEPWHVASPVRKSLKRVDFVHGRVTGVDAERRMLAFRPNLDRDESTIHYDHLIVAAGSVPSSHGVPGVEEHSLPFRTLPDASTLHNHVVALLEEADATEDHSARNGLLTFAAIGGGYSGVECILQLCDLCHALVEDYEQLEASDLRFVLVHSHERLMPQVTENLAHYTRKKLDEKGIECIFGVHANRIDTDRILLEDGREIRTHTPVWTAGLRPAPLIAEMPGDRSRAGALRTDAHLRVQGADRIWAVGDCAQIPNVLDDGEPFPLTAQHAERQGRHVAENVWKQLRGEPTEPLRYRSPGMLVPLGRHDAVAEIYGWTFAGIGAWFIWRTVYWWLLPGLAKKFRVAMDWTAELLFGRDVVLTQDPLVLGSRRTRRTSSAAGIDRDA